MILYVATPSSWVQGIHLLYSMNLFCSSLQIKHTCMGTSIEGLMSAQERYPCINMGSSEILCGWTKQSWGSCCKKPRLYIPRLLTCQEKPVMILLCFTMQRSLRKIIPWLQFWFTELYHYCNILNMRAKGKNLWRNLISSRYSLNHFVPWPCKFSHTLQCKGWGAMINCFI